ncbi:BnaC01g40550D [Brassica napus]|uniref:BnaC01g40550D protein n=1 Tax=Brassica napus TaxID=3708 RepID=A0A078GZB7_BRANA|nr:BnaC01g40550D [Brassica napus]
MDPMLILDLVIMVMERLSFVDFYRARCVSSVWYSASKSCRMRQANPWLVLFPADVLHLPLESIDDSYRKTRFYLLNMLTRERIHLPSLDSMESTEDNVTLLSTCYGIGAAVLWVDERNKDYFVVWAFDRSLAYHKKGDDGWRVFRSSTNQSCVDMVFIESKLYVLIEDGSITAFDFSCGDSPMEFAILGISRERRHSLNIYKMDPKSSKWKATTIVSGRMITGFASSILIHTKNEVQLFNHLTASSPLSFKDARWFVPTFGGK